MANAFAPTGLQAIKTITAASFSGQTQSFPITTMLNNVSVPYASTIYTGDPVFLSGGGLKSQLINGAATSFCVGVFLGCFYESSPNTSSGITTTSSGNPIYPANTVGYNNTGVVSQIVSDPHIVFTVLMAGGTAAAPAALTAANKLAAQNIAGALGKVTVLANNAGNPVTGMSKCFLPIGNVTFPGAGGGFAQVANTVAVRVLGINQNPSLNESSQDDYLFVDVMLAQHLYNSSIPEVAPQLKLNDLELEKEPPTKNVCTLTSSIKGGK